MIRSALALAARGFKSFRAGPCDKRPATANGLKTPPPTQTSSGLGGGNSLTTISPSLPDRRLASSSSTWMVLTPKLHSAGSRRNMGCCPTVEVITARGRHISFNGRRTDA